jgi:hypothetical protein
LPIAEVTFNNLAVRPSKKSNIAPNNMKIEGSNMFSDTYRKYMDNAPHKRLVNVMQFGMCFFIILSAKI